MNSIETIVSQLNQILTTTEFEKTAVIALVNKLKASGINKMKIYDFEYFNEQLANSLKLEKIELIKMQIFDAAAAMRDKEKECLDYILLKEELAVSSSIFICRDGFLFYCYFGDAKNDKEMRSFIK